MGTETPQVEFSPPSPDESWNLRERSVGAIGWTTLVVLADRLIQIGFLAVLARLLTPQETGVMTAAAAAVSMVSLTAMLGIPASLVQIAEFTPRLQAIARTTLTVYVAIAVAAVFLLAPLAGRWFNNPDVTTVLRVLILILIAQPFSVLASVNLQRGLRARALALADLASNLASVALVTVPLALGGASYWALVWGAMAQVAIRTGLLCLFARQPVAFALDPSASLALGRRSAPYFLNTGLLLLSAGAPLWIIGRYQTAQFLGLFSRAHTLMTYPATLFAAVADRVIFPAVSLVKGDMERLRTGMLDAIRVTALAGLPLTAALVILGPDIIRFILGPAWEGAIEPFSVLCLATYFRLGDRLNGLVLRGVGKPSRLAAVQVVFFALLITGCVLSVDQGLAAVAWVVVGVSVLNYAAVGTVALRTARIGLASWIAAHGPGAASALLAAAVLTPIAVGLHAAGGSPGVVLAASAAASVGVGGLAVWLAPKVFLGEAGIRLWLTVRGLLVHRRGAA